MNGLPHWIHRLMAVSILVLLIATIAVFVVAPLVEAYQTTERQLTQAAERLERYRSLGRSRPALEQRLAELRERRDNSGIYLQGETDALAGAQLQEQVKRTVEANGGTLRSIQVLPTTEVEKFRKLTLRLIFVATTDSLFRSLYGLEAQKPFLFIENFEVRAGSQRRARRRNRDNEDNESELLVRFDLYGYLRPGAV